jgi:hypothetical protein
MGHMAQNNGRGPTRTGDFLGVNEVLWPTELRAPLQGLLSLATSAILANRRCKSWRVRCWGSMRLRRGRGVRVGLWLAGILVVALVASQLLLPVLAARVMRQRVGRYGPVLSASIHAFPALELLWGQAGSASVRTGPLRLNQAQATDLLWSARGVDSLDVFSSSLEVGNLRLSEVHVIKRGAGVRVLATLTEADLSAALPAGVQVQGLSGGGDGQLEVRVGGELFGVRASVVAVVAPSEGKLVAEPRGLSFGGLARITLFSDPHVHVQTFALRPLRGGSTGWGLDLRATLG